MQALYLITQGARAAAFRNVKTIAECLVRHHDFFVGRLVDDLF
jgi:hypothetical protein